MANLQSGSWQDQTPNAASSWRGEACLAGQQDACLWSEISATRCAAGNEAACRPYFFEPSDTPERQSQKLPVLKSACGRGVSHACSELIGTLPEAEIVELACRTPRGCEQTLSKLSEKTLIGLCESSATSVREAGCSALLSTHGEEGVPAVAQRWARAKCAAPQKGDEDVCREWSGVLRGMDRPLEAARLWCRLPGLGFDNDEPCDNQEVLESIDACLKGSSAACPLAALRSQGLRQRHLHAEESVTFRTLLEKACGAGEAMFCLEAATFEPMPPIADRLQWLKGACTIDKKSGCEEVRELEAASRSCSSAGSCVAWVDEMSLEERRLTGLGLLEKACLGGQARDCAAYRELLPIGAAIRRCTDDPKFCVKPVDRARFRVLVQKCDQGQVPSCKELLSALDAPSLRYGRPAARDVDLERWNTAACQGGVPEACFWLAQRIGDESRTKAFERACDVGSGYACATLAQNAWEDASRTQGKADLLSPALVRARQYALRACELVGPFGCPLAADFLESGIGGPKDELEAARLRQ